MLLVKSFYGRNKFGQLLWFCRCDCGNDCIVRGCRISSGRTKSCGCLREKNLLGQQFGYWLVVEKIPGKKRQSLWKVKCICGNVCAVTGSSLSEGRSSSCGCMNIELTLQRGKIGSFNGKHYNSNHRLYKIFYGMKNRCYNKNCKFFKNYGGKGIIICNEWLNSFTNFFEWSIENGYQQGLSIDRIDPNLGYFPENCRWITMRENSSRARSSADIGKVFNGWRHEKKIPFTTQSIFICVKCQRKKQIGTYFGKSSKHSMCKCAS